MNVKNAYSQWAASYDAMQNKTRDLELLAGQQVLAEQRFDNALELGCGTGKNSEWLRKQCRRLTCVDVSDAMLTVARRKLASAANVEFVLADVQQEWLFAQENAQQYDLITCSLVLEHMKDLQPIFRQLALHLAPRGVVFVCELHPFKQLVGGGAAFGDNQRVVSHCHHVSEFCELASAHGLRVRRLNEWFDATDESKRLPRLLSLVLERNVECDKSRPPIVLEACVSSLRDAVQAQANGAHRLELCSALELGGLTPGYGLQRLVIGAVSIPVFVMIRPRAGDDFCYDEHEVQVMEAEIDASASLGARGVVFGALTADKSLHEATTARLVHRAKAHSLAVTFHRAIDHAAEPITVIEKLVQLGVDRVLTSGGAASAIEGAQQIAQWHKQFGKQITFVAGAGVRAHNREQLIESTKVNEIHGTRLFSK